MAFRKIDTAQCADVIVTIARNSDDGEYRCRLAGKPEADYFTNDSADAHKTAQSMAASEYKRLRKQRADAIPATILDQLHSIAWRMWQQVGSDAISACEECGEPMNNEQALEVCFDADRPRSLLGEKEGDFCDTTFKAYTYDACMFALHKKRTHLH